MQKTPATLDDYRLFCLSSGKKNSRWTTPVTICVSSLSSDPRSTHTKCRYPGIPDWVLISRENILSENAALWWVRCCSGTCWLQSHFIWKKNPTEWDCFDFPFEAIFHFSFFFPMALKWYTVLKSRTGGRHFSHQTQKDWAIPKAIASPQNFTGNGEKKKISFQDWNKWKRNCEVSQEWAKFQRRFKNPN